MAHNSNSPLLVIHSSFEDDLQQLTQLMSAKDKMVCNRTLGDGYSAVTSSVDDAIKAISTLIKAKAEWQVTNIPKGGAL